MKLSHYLMSYQHCIFALLTNSVVTTRAARVVLFSVVFVCVSVCQHGNS